MCSNDSTWIQTIGKRYCLAASLPCVLLSVCLTVTGCGFGAASSGAKSDNSGGAASSDSGSQESGSTGDGPSTTDALKSQREWEAKFTELSKEVTAARETGNQIVQNKKAQALQSFLDSTWKPGASLSGWIGRVEGIEATDKKAPDRAGKDQPVLKGTLCLADGSEPGPYVYFFNWDPADKRSTGLIKEYEGLKRGDVVRVWGVIRAVDGQTVATFATQKIEPYDLAQRRVEHLKLWQKYADALDGIEKAQGDVAKAFRAADREGEGHGRGWYLQVAYTWPEYRKAMKELNAYKPIPEAKLDEMTQALAESKRQLETGRLLDENQELTSLREREAWAAKTLSEVNRQVENGQVALKYLGLGQETVRLKDGPFREVPESESVPPGCTHHY